MGEALDHDSRGRAPPAWQGCRVVAGDEVFLINWQSEDSFDGRYFGPLPASTIVGRADPLNTLYMPRHLAAAPSVHLPELSPGAATGGMVSALWPCFSSPQVL